MFPAISTDKDNCITGWTEPWQIAIAGAGVSGFAILGHLVTQLRDKTEKPIQIFLFQPKRTYQEANLTKAQKTRLAYFKALDKPTLIGGGQVYDPMQPALFTFNGGNAVRGFDFAQQHFDTANYFDWMQANRNLLATLYPDFAPEQGQQRHPDHNLDDLHGTSPRGAYGLYLDEQFRRLLAHLPRHISVQTIPQAIQSFIPSEQMVQMQTVAASYQVNQLVCTIGHRFAPIRPEWQGQVFAAYPCDHYGAELPAHLTIVGAGPSGIEVALHALNNLGVERVSLVSRRGYARLPQIEPAVPYTCPWLTRQQMQRNPTAQWAQCLLKQSLLTAYQVSNLAYPGWEAMLHIENYGRFLADYMQQATPAHPLARLVRPVMSFFSQSQDLLSSDERVKLQQLLSSVKHLFATQSWACAEMMLAAMQTGRLSLQAGTFLPHCKTPTIVGPDSKPWQPNSVILATGFDSQIAPIYSLAIAQGAVVIDDSGELAVNPTTGALMGTYGTNINCYQVAGTSLSSVDRQAAQTAKALVQQMALYR
ncbi:MAG: FAD/NAD(P)-binding protein [Cyanobacteria bacterium J06554_1]